METPVIFVTNDDSISAKGLRSLIEALSPLGRIIAIAPAEPRSGQSAAITVGRPLHITRHPDYLGAEMYAVSGTPVDCVKLGLHAIVREKPQLLVAGINHGSNSGNSEIYSGTMGAVMEGCTVGIPSVGFSLLHHSLEADFTECTPIVRDICSKVLAQGLPADICLNVNIPALCKPEGVKVTRAARGHWTEEYADYTDPSGHPFYWLTGRFVNAEPNNPDTDEYWLARQWATVVPVDIDRSAAEADIERIALELGYSRK